jgi:hypothetical protein
MLLDVFQESYRAELHALVIKEFKTTLHRRMRKCECPYIIHTGCYTELASGIIHTFENCCSIDLITLHK